MSLDVYLEQEERITVTRYTGNITHNLARMAQEADLYKCLWRPEEVGIEKAQDLIEPLKKGLKMLKANPEHFKKFNSPNGWGTYEYLVIFVECYLNACEIYPCANVSTWR
jgi:hypothetical protein